MRRIDFMGAPGTGKSAVYDHLRQLQPGSFLSVEEAREKAVCNYLIRSKRSNSGSILNAAIRLQMIRTGLLNRAVNLTKYIITSQQESLYLRFAQENEAFIRACADAFKAFMDIGIPSCARYFLSAKWFMQKLAEIQLFQEQLNQNDLVLFDESLCHKIYELVSFDYLPVPDHRWEKIENIFWFMPLPHAVIFLKEDVEVIEKRLVAEPRLRQREILKRDPGAFRRWVEDAVKLAEIGKSIIRQREVKLFELPEAGDVSDRAMAVKIFLEKELKCNAWS